MANQPNQWTEEQKRQYYEQYRRQYAQYYQQQAQYQQQQQPQRQPAKKRTNPIVTSMIIIIGVLVLVILYIAIAQMGQKQQPTAPAQPDVIKIDTNGVVLSDTNLTLRSPAYYVDDDAFVYTKFSNFKNEFEDNQYNIRLSYGLRVFDPSGKQMPVISNDNLYTIDQGYDDYPVTDYYFTAKIMTLNLKPGEYKIVSTVKDELTGISQTAEQKITLSKPTTIRVAGPYFADIADNSFKHRDNEYKVGDQIQMMAQIRGFVKEGNKTNVRVKLEVMDNEGYLQPDMSKYDLHTFKEVSSPEQDFFVLNIYTDTKNITPGVYWFKITAVDSLSGMSHLTIKPAIIR